MIASHDAARARCSMTSEGAMGATALKRETGELSLRDRYSGPHLLGGRSVHGVFL